MSSDILVDYRSFPDLWTCFRSPLKCDQNAVPLVWETPRCFPELEHIFKSLAKEVVDGCQSRVSFYSMPKRDLPNLANFKLGGGSCVWFGWCSCLVFACHLERFNGILEKIWTLGQLTKGPIKRERERHMWCCDRRDFSSFLIKSSWWLST